MRVGDGGGGGWVGRALGAELEPPDAAIEAAMARAELEILDEVELGAALGAGDDAVAAGAGRDRAARVARALLRALVESRDEIPELGGGAAELSAALAEACSSCNGELRALLDEYLAMRREVAAGAGSISSG